MVNDILDLSHIETGDYEIRPQHWTLRRSFDAVNRVVSPLAQERARWSCVRSAIAQDLALTADRRPRCRSLQPGSQWREIRRSGRTGIGHGGLEPDGTVRLDVVDDGAGIPEADLAG